jgi:hypothetical protein
MKRLYEYKLTWAPEGKVIATVHAPSELAARRLAPYPYRHYLGEIYAVRTDSGFQTA